MSDRRLQVFHTVAGVLSFTRAAEILNMTQPAVTFQVRQLEEDFNTRLFDRAHNRISLTKAGELALGYADRIVGLYGEMHESVKEMTGDNTGLITIGASTTIAECQYHHRRIYAAGTAGRFSEPVPGSAGTVESGKHRRHSDYGGRQHDRSGRCRRCGE